jgi:hypothetical protein
MRRIVCSFLLALAAAASLSATNILLNGDFETVDGRLDLPVYGTPPFLRPLDQLTTIGKAAVYTSLPGWWLWSGVGVEVQVDPVLSFVSPHSGQHYIELDAHPHGSQPSTSAIAQTVHLVPGWYRLAFWYFPRMEAGAPTDENLIAAYLDSPSSLPLLAANSYRQATTTWTLLQTSFFIASPGARHIILAAGGPANGYGGLVDDVSLELLELYTPEPATFALAGAGLLALIWMRRRRA